MIDSRSAVWEPLRVLASGAIDANYALIGDRLLNPTRIIDFINTCNETVFLSINGIDDHIVVPGNGGKTKDMCAARNGGDFSGLFVSAQTQFWVRCPSGPATGGSVYIEVIYSGLGD